MCSKLQVRVETSGPTEVVRVKWGERGVLSLPLAHRGPLSLSVQLLVSAWV